jgi:gliding motility-associated protein GldE
LEAEDPNQYLLILSSVTVYPPTTGVFIGFIILAVMLVLSAFISGSEVAFFSMTPANIDDLSKNKSRRASDLLTLVFKPERLLATILVANNFVNVSIVILAAYLSGQLFDFSENPLLGFILEVGVITFILLLFGEILPKVYATRKSLQFALLMATPLVFLEKAFRPISFILIKSSAVTRKLNSRNQISKGELAEAISLASGDNRDDEKILKGIVKFGNIYAREIMQPRIDVSALDIKTPFKDVIPFIIESGYSRIPIYNGSFDTVEGILYIKDLLQHFHKPNSFNWQSLIRPPYYVPETKKINDLLEEFQTKKIHMAVVIDEYGGTSGIITLEDILEEIMGEIPDETVNDEIHFEKIDDNTYLFKGKTQLNDFFKVFEIEEDPFEDVRGESDTLAGLILEITGEIPEIGLTVSHSKFNFTIISADKRRIKKIKVEVSK